MINHPWKIPYEFATINLAFSKGFFCIKSLEFHSALRVTWHNTEILAFLVGLGLQIQAVQITPEDFNE